MKNTPCTYAFAHNADVGLKSSIINRFTEIFRPICFFHPILDKQFSIPSKERNLGKPPWFFRVKITNLDAF